MKNNQCAISKNAEDFLKYASKPTYITQKIFGKDYAAIHQIKPVLILNKPIYVGFTALDLSKWKMYDLHYNFIKKNFDAELLFTDTDSPTYEIKSENIYAFSVLVLSTKIGGSVFWKNVLFSRKFVSKLMYWKRSKFPFGCNIKTFWSLQQRAILKIPSTVF